MRVILDTHALLGWVAGDERIDPELRSGIAAEDAVVFVSAASAWEIAIKAQSGKLVPGPLLPGFAAAIVHEGFLPLPITQDHSERAGLLPPVHGDPFDRMLVAQAQAENLHLVSSNRIFDRYGVVRIW